MTKTTAKTPAKAPVKAPTRKAKPASQPITRKQAVSRKAAAPAKPVKAAKVKKPKLVRDSYTMPKDEYAVLGTLKTRGAKLGQPIKKSELLRAGLKLLAGLNDKALAAALKALPAAAAKKA